MSDNKKYYYLKLKENFYDSDEMVLLESMNDGYLYSNILLKLYLRSLKNNGKLMLNDKVPFNDTMLASITRHSIGNIKQALIIFQQLGLIEILSNGAIYINQIQNFIGKSSSEGDRKREYRLKIEEEKKLIKNPNGQKLGQMSDIYPPEKEIEKELEIYLDDEELNEIIKFINSLSKLGIDELISDYISSRYENGKIKNPESLKFTIMKKIEEKDRDTLMGIASFEKINFQKTLAYQKKENHL